MKFGNIVGLTPFETPDAGLVEAFQRAGSLGILDLGRQPQIGLSALDQLSTRGLRGFGVRIPELNLYPNLTLPSLVTHVVLDAKDLLNSTVSLEQFSKQKVWIQVCSMKEARETVSAFRPHGLIAKGSESGGRIGSAASFILLQEIATLSLPFWVQGGIGVHSAAAALFAGAEAVVLDSQLMLFAECGTVNEVKEALSHMEGTETRIVHSHQVFTRPDLKIPHESDIGLAGFLEKLGAASLKNHFIPAGQDLSFAKGLAEKYRNIRTLVQAMTRSSQGHLRQAKAHLAFAPGAALAVANGTHYPVAQGPMTRVSDKAEFIAAVSTNGALPFLALSLMGKNASRAILQETSDKLGSKPWGVGILGFAPDDLHQEQLEVLADFHPTAVLIAGGRPSQAQTFEKRGIKTYLHVPSPGLLKQFLKDGARKFVFEGRECGGHVGPRSSFVLWETQIEILLASDSVHELEVYFAGGIHDAKSAALVAAMSAPLSARGAKVGVLIGTAYLFTEEAVASGAILKRFQNEALTCSETALLETAPGHATRCAQTPFVQAFEAKKEELRSSGLESKTIWAELEGLNVGKLRLASKGLERIGSELVAVADDRQESEGLYMLGQVAEMRHAVCTMRELHEDLTTGSMRLLGETQLKTEPARALSDVAIVGMACIFPGAKDVQSYWKNILTGEDLVTEVPETRWSKDTYYSNKLGEANKSISKWGGFIDDIEFDPLEFGIPPNSMAAIEPTQLLSLKVAKQALADAGYAHRSFDRERTSVIFGAEAGTDLASAYGFRAHFPMFAGEIPEGLDNFLPSLTEDSFPGVLANVISGRIANRLDLGGSNYTVDAACASSLAALDLAVKELSGGESDMVLCGGADLHNSVNDYLMFSSVKALSPSGKSRPFSANADGIVLAEGVAVIVLKRLDDAIRDQDKIYSVIKGIGSSSDGKSLGLTAPRKEGQMRALYRAYERAGVSPSDIELVEAHGTGTVVGDRTELQTLSEVYSEAGSLTNSCALGSVKSQIGHSKCAAGLAGVIKTSLAIYHGIIPPTLHADEPNPYYKRPSSPFYFSPIARPWTSPVRKAAVSAFGFGGTNFHTVLSSHELPTLPKISGAPAELFLFESRDELKQLKTVLTKHSSLSLARLARTVSENVKVVQTALVACSMGELEEKIDLALASSQSNAPKGIFLASSSSKIKGKIAVLFSGQGSQSVNMGAEIFNSFPELRKHLARGSKWTQKIFPSGNDSQGEENLKQTRNTQPALGVVDLAFYDLLKALGLEADMLGGHSYGELVALAAAGGISAEDLLPLSEARALAIETAAQGQSGSMAAVSATIEALEPLLKNLNVTIANHNAPSQVVITGESSAIDHAIAELKIAGLSAKKIPVSAAFHSPMLAKAEHYFAEALDKVVIHPLQKPVYSNTTAKLHANDVKAIQSAYAKQIVKPVKWVDEVRAMHDDGARLFLEVGPGAVLKGLVDRILEGREFVSRSLGKSGNTLQQFLTLIAELTSLGVTIRPEILYSGRDLDVYDLSKLAQYVPSQTLWLVNGHLSAPKFGSIPKGGLKPGEFKVDMSNMGASNETREGVVKDYLQAMRLMVESQKQVMLQYLGSEVTHVITTTSTPVLTQQIAAKPRVQGATSAPREERSVDVSAASLVAQKSVALDLPATVLSVVSAKTGYPTDMLDFDQDLEADLSIDSIKRFEILAELSERLGDQLNSKGGNLEKLGGIKTLRQLIAALEAQLVKSESKAIETESPKLQAVETQSEAHVSQYLFRIEEAPLSTASNSIDLEGRSFTLLEDKLGVARALAKRLIDAKAEVKLLPIGQTISADEKADGLIMLSLLDDSFGSKPTEIFTTLKYACQTNVQAILGVTTRGGNFGDSGQDLNRGISGLFKSLAKEYEGKQIKIIDLDVKEDANRLAGYLFEELISGDPLVEVGYAAGVRRQMVAVPLITDFGQEKFSLNQDSVVLMLGGARGIAAQIAMKLAQQYSCKFEIVGRSPIADHEDASIASIKDFAGLRKHFIAAKIFKKPSEIEAECRRILNDREMRETFAQLESLGSATRYHCFDVRSKEKLSKLIDDLYLEGRIDGVIHAAGVLRDSLILEKSAESFALVFETKVNPAEVLEAKLQSDVKFVALFSSVAGCFGNRGQTDYAAANNALDLVARSLGRKVQGRTLSINWGPWGGTGMVTPELENEYKRRGIGLIPPHVGSQKFLDELRFGEQSTRQVVIMSGSPESFGQA
ncbi:MAG: SDR family oxidoreductase [Proteobacteria bacterium]|nr:MAG: SDR family oxidoreductase [Pseudomonadota bacterium]